MNRSDQHKSRRDDWATPPDVFQELDEQFHFTLDVCASAENTKCARYFDVETDGLLQSWQDEVCFLNPPYGVRSIDAWLEKATHASRKENALTVALLPATVEAHWFQDHVLLSARPFLFWPRRIAFIDPTIHGRFAPVGGSVVVVISENSLVLKWIREQPWARAF